MCTENIWTSLDYLFSKLSSDKTYHSSEEENHRMGVFSANLDKINKHNAEGVHSYSLAMNHLGDLTAEEFKKMLNGYRPPANKMV